MFRFLATGRWLPSQVHCEWRNVAFAPEGGVADLIDADLSALGPNLTILGGMEKGEALVGADYRNRPDFWRLS